jgi:hypothetical protein
VDDTKGKREASERERREMTEAIVPNGSDATELAVVTGDLAKLSPQQRVNYYQAVCRSIGVNPLTKPFDYIVLNGKLTLYARKDATEQLRRRDNVSLSIKSREKIEDIFMVTATATLPNGRADESVGAVNVLGLNGDVLANAYMKAETKAKRRVTLSICGLGWLDESEVDSIPDAKHVEVTEDGEIVTARASGTCYTSDPDSEPVKVTMPEQPPEESEPLDDTPVPAGTTMEQLVKELGGKIVTPPNFNANKTPEQKKTTDGMTHIGRVNHVLALTKSAGWNSFKTTGHIGKHFQKTTMKDMTDEDLITFEKQLDEEIRNKNAKKEDKIPAHLMMPENLGEEQNVVKG